MVVIAATGEEGVIVCFEIKLSKAFKKSHNIKQISNFQEDEPVLQCATGSPRSRS